MFPTCGQSASSDSMGAKHDNLWLNDFSFVLERQRMRHLRAMPEHEVFASSKLVAVVWLVMMSAVGGAFGGTLVSGALWRSLLSVPLWLLEFILVCLVT